MMVDQIKAAPQPCRIAPVHAIKNNNPEAGFTLMELLITIAIISILAMIATPLYQNHAFRAKISSEIPLMNPVQKMVSEMHAIENVWPVNNQQAGAKSPASYKGRYLQSVEVTNDPVDGAILLTYDIAELPALTGRNTIIYYPTEGATTVIWSCDGGTMTSKYRPSNCQ